MTQRDLTIHHLRWSFRNRKELEEELRELEEEIS